MNGTGFAAFLQFGALGLLGVFMYLSYQQYKEGQEYLRQLIQQMIALQKDSIEARKQASADFQEMCREFNTIRESEEREHDALLEGHRLLMDDHRKITGSLGKLSGSD